MNNRRHDLRSRAFKSGTISAPSGSMDCLKRNVSKTGACVQLNNDATAVPDEFRLIIKPEGLFRTCKVIWQEGQRLGVIFK
jgi:hypothetical protein